MMREAFRPDGARTGMENATSKQDATSELFAGLMGAFKNASSHRDLQLDSPIEAASIIHFAGLLVRVVDRAKERRSVEVPDG
jgi:hypothetical protein